MEKRLLIVLIVLCIAISGANAAGFSVTVVPKTTEILVDTNQAAKYDLVISNNYPFEDTFQIEVRDSSWNIAADPLADYVGGGPDIGPGKQYTVHLLATPMGKRLLGRQSFPLIVKSLINKEEISKQIFVEVVSEKPVPRDYALALDVSVSIPEFVDPRESPELIVDVASLYLGNISDIILKIDSRLIKVQTKFNLKSLGKTTLTFPLKFSPYQSPQIDKVTLTFSKGDKVLNTLNTRFTVQPYTDLTKTMDETKDGFLRYGKKITFVNNGNTDQSPVLFVRTNFFKRIFTSTTPTYYIMKNQTGTYLAWEISLQPVESATISITENFTLLFWGILVLLLVWLLYMFLRSPLILEKGAKVVELKEGAISQIKVLITIRNRTRKQLTNIRLADRVPDIGAINQEFDMGTLHPEKIVRDERGGTVLRWIIPSIEPFEERLITYKIRTKLKVVGTFALPSALVKFKTSAGTELKTKSTRGRVIG